jgi:hypothetical protein
MKFFAIESRELYIVERPVELYVLTGTDLLCRGLNDSGGKEIDSFGSKHKVIKSVSF